ncbi:MAG TPA: hypothetical protein VJA21_26645, partial [Verrucomicrobiae bacterium]
MKKENRFRVPRVYCAAVLVVALNVLAVSAAETKIDPKTLDAYVGQYELQEARFVFRRQGDALLCQVAKEGVFH